MTRIITKLSGIENDDTGNVVITQGVNYSVDATVTPPALTSNTDDLLVDGLITAVLLRLSSTGNYDLTGIIPPNPLASQELKIFNIGSNNIVIRNDSNRSDAENRFFLGGNRTIQTNEGVSVIYDPVSQKWRGTGIII
jgi:hypothetical protein